MARGHGHGQRPARAQALEAPTLSEQDGVRYLHLGTEWVQGAMRLSRPSELVLGYTRQMMAWLLFVRPGQRDTLAILGLGAGALLRFCLRHTRSQVVTVEHNERVVAFCRSYFRLPEPERARIDLADARVWVAEPQRAGRYKALMVDVYDGQAQGPVCDDPAFYRDCHRVLEEGGVMAVNLFSRHPSWSPNVRGIRAAFKGLVLRLPEIDEGNVVLLAFKGTLPDLHGSDTLARAQWLEARLGLPAVQWLHALQQEGLVV
ncbi:spermidine synthase [Castellaniella sp.]|uniref:spermine/spermidine synthase domain-containing protein n=1 Tax=Castellaniella sp. TaxID=1955812 RepID=UPI003568FBE2